MLKNKCFLIFSALFLMFNCVNVYAVDFNLGDVLVSATKTQAYQSEVGASATVISSEDIARSGKTTVLDVLENTPGVCVTSTGVFGGAASIDIRGAKRGQTLVMIDGVEVYDPMAVTKDFDFAHIGVNNIDRIEIVRGAQSTLYGSDAMAGVINIITKKGKGDLQASVVLEGGAHSTLSESLALSGSSNNINFSVSLSRMDSDGVSKARDGGEEDAYKNTSFATRIGTGVFENLDLFAGARYIYAQTDIDDGAYQDDPNRTTDSKHIIGDIGFIHELNDNWNHKLTFSGTSFDRNDSDPADAVDTTENEFSRYRGDRRKVEWQHNLSFADWDTETLGYEYEEERGSSYSTGTMWWSNNQFDRRVLQNRALYLQSQAQMGDDFFLTGGCRVDRHDIFGSHATYKMSSSYMVADTDMRLKATYGTAFRAPNLYQLYDANYGNAQLDAEKSRGFDIGAEQRLLDDRLFLSAVYFYAKYKNLIDSDPVTWKYVNIKNGTARGYELESVFDMNGSVKLGGNYTYTKTRDGDTAREFGRRPKHQVSAFLDWDYSEKGNVYLSGRYIGSRMDAPAYNTNKNKKYTVVDIAANYNLNDTLQVFSRVDNIFDRSYEPIRGYNGIDRSLYAGIKGQF